MNSFQTLIAKSRYARYLPEKQRRENWDETVDRWEAFFREHLKEHLPKIENTFKHAVEAIRDMEVLPSMRSLMTAGPALKLNNVAAYNCSYLPIDHVYSFDEAMFILLSGTGVGFSVEEKYVSKINADALPIIQPLRKVPDIIIVEDSKEGWCYALRELIQHLYTGRIPTWDVSLVRPAGAPLKTFGGRASGPEPLVSLFEFTIDIFKKAEGRKLNTLEVHDILCKIGDIVVVGGVRRSAMISLGDLNDHLHATCKSGEWWKENGHRRLSNNSAVYEKKPSMGQFMTEWLNLYNSHSGERGIFNREAARMQASKYGRRNNLVAYGTNPCAEIILQPYQFCNLSTIIVRPEDNMDTLLRKVSLATFIGTIQSTLTDFPYLRPIWKEQTEKERLLGVSMTGVFSNGLLIDGSPTYLDKLREKAVECNTFYAFLLGIPPSAAITCVKPEGTVSQLTLTESGLHPAHAPYYIRRIRQDEKDPLTKFLIDAGVPNEPCVMSPKTTRVFSFPMKSQGYLTRDSINAVQHLEIWKKFQRHWCEHKPSVTISVKEHEWMEVGAWVWKNFDECTGVSFLPDDGGIYQQAPYEAITENRYKELLKQEVSINWEDFIETTDNVEGVQTLACTSGACEL